MESDNVRATVLVSSTMSRTAKSRACLPLLPARLGRSNCHPASRRSPLRNCTVFKQSVTKSSIQFVSLTFRIPKTMSQQNNQRWAQQNPNAMPDRQAAVKPPEQIEYLCGGELVSGSTPALQLGASCHWSPFVLIPDCGAKSSMRVTEAVRCKECGHRVMYKPRTHRSECCCAAHSSSLIRSPS